MKSSILSMITATMGAGSLTIPYIFGITGLGLGIILVILGALASYYSGMLIVRAIIKAYPQIGAL